MDVGQVKTFRDMKKIDPTTFEAQLRRPAAPGDEDSWAFLVLPKATSDTLPRRGRTSVEGHLNGCPFRATLEPDGQLSHWLKVSHALQQKAGVSFGDTVTVRINPAEPEPEPSLPDDLREALASSEAAMATWNDTTTLARVDWIHWIESAKQLKTRARRVENACDMLAQGERRVCCFDQSGFYSKSLSAPKIKA